MAVCPRTTICIDALDEVDHKLRLDLLKALKHVVEKSNTLVKVFATTPMDTDILMQFAMFPRIELEPDDNVDDINRFVRENTGNDRREAAAPRQCPTCAQRRNMPSSLRAIQGNVSSSELLTDWCHS